MSEQQKAPIRDVQVDEILAQVEKKRASHGGKTPKASEAQLDAILKSMGLGERKRPRYSEPILLPSPVQEDVRGSAAPAPGSAAQAAPAAPQESSVQPSSSRVRNARAESIRAARNAQDLNRCSAPWTTRNSARSP